MSSSAGRPVLTLGHVLEALGSQHDLPIGLEDMLLIRHVFKPWDPEALHGPEDLGDDQVLQYTRSQDISTRKFPGDPPPYWVILVADGKRRARLLLTYRNHGESLGERTETHRFWNLERDPFLDTLADRLVVDWTSPRSWHRRASRASSMQVVEIADRDSVPFPGFDQVRLPFHELQAMVEDRRYSDWRAALSEVQGIYLITDTTTGQQYVGKADGTERILGRWAQYARNGHGGNVAMLQLVGAGEVKQDVVARARHLVFSILRVFGPSTSTTEVDAAESHYKKALMTREFGMNRN